MITNEDTSESKGIYLKKTRKDTHESTVLSQGKKIKTNFSAIPIKSNINASLPRKASVIEKLNPKRRLTNFSRIGVGNLFNPLTNPSILKEPSDISRTSKVSRLYSQFNQDLKSEFIQDFEKEKKRGERKKKQQEERYRIYGIVNAPIS